MIEINQLVDHIHKTPHLGVILTAGGGSGVLPILMRRGGASATILDAGVPHGKKAVPRWLGLDTNRPDLWPPAVSSKVGRGLAMAAFIHAMNLDDKGPHFGIGCTVSLAKQGAERAGREHKVFAALQTKDRTTEYSFVFPSTALGSEGLRESEEGMVEKTMLELIRLGCDLDEKYSCWDMVVDVALEGETADYLSCGHMGLPDLIAGDANRIIFRLNPGSRPQQAGGYSIAAQQYAMLSSSLDPPHPGHRKMRRITTERTGLPCHLEMPIRNAAKPPLDYIEISRRLDGIGLGEEEDQGFLVLTNRGTFVEKSNLFPNTTFAIGYDTAIRIPESKYYGSVRERNLVYESLHTNGARFLIFGRVDKNGFFQNINLNEPSSFPDKETYDFFSTHCETVPESEFRQDVSSSEIRKKANL